MANKNKDKNKNKKGHPAQNQFGQFRDLTAERYFDKQMAKIEKLCEDEEFEEALSLMEGLAEKYPRKAELFELMGITCIALEELDPARNHLEHALELNRNSKEDVSLIRYNLAHVYVLSGFPLLANEQAELINWAELGRLIKPSSEVDQFRQLCQQALEEAAAEHNESPAELLKYALPIERGQLALTKGDHAEARSQLEAALASKPDIAEAYNILALVELADGNIDLAIDKCRYVLDKLNPHNLESLSTLLRLFIIKGETGQLQAYQATIAALPKPETAEDVVRLASIMALLEDDRAVFELLSPLFDLADDLNDQLDDLADETLEDALVLMAVAAGNRGQPEKAVEILHEYQGDSENVLLDRTHYALEHGELGPRENGRYFYFDPSLLHPFEVAFMGELITQAAVNKDKVTPQPDLLKPFFEQYGQTALDLITYQSWVSEETMVASALLSQLIVCQVAGGTELVERLAFGRAGSEVQRLVAAAVLADTGVINPEKPVTLWLGDHQQTGTLEELTAQIAQRQQDQELNDEGGVHH